MSFLLLIGGALTLASLMSPKYERDGNPAHKTYTYDDGTPVRKTWDDGSPIRPGPSYI